MGKVALREKLGSVLNEACSSFKEAYVNLNMAVFELPTGAVLMVLLSYFRNVFYFEVYNKHNFGSLQVQLTPTLFS